MVTAGQIKLRSGCPVIVNNSIQPTNEQAPQPKDQYGGRMRKFTDIFIERPVLATVVSLTLLVLGLRSIGLLPVLQFPQTQNAVVTVTTTYFGADPALVAGFITTPLEASIAQANGIDFMSSSSRQSVSTITAALRLNYDVDKALTEINTKVNAVLNQLPPGSQQPVLTVKVGQTFFICGTSMV